MTIRRFQSVFYAVLALSALLATFLAAGCSDSSSPSAPKWSMIAGATSAAQAGTATCPGARYYSASWTAASGDLWLFGGRGVDFNGDHGRLNDLWKFDTTLSEWNRIAVGSTQSDQPGSDSEPGARQGSAAWADTAGNLWLFGGEGYDFAGNQGKLNDLWKFDTALSEWNRIAVGSTQTFQPGAPSRPGARSGGAAWADAAGNFWLFGGDGLDFSGASGKLNDLWKFDPTLSEWSRVAVGSTIANQPGAPSCPGGRSGSAAWADTSGNFWLFGGDGLDFSGAPGKLNDLWKFDPTLSEWNRVAVGSTIANQPGTALCPGSRHGSAAWADTAGNLWLFGGRGYDFASADNGYLGDLWMFAPGSTTWTFVGGSNLAGDSSDDDAPGGRFACSVWAPPSGGFWLFGGDGVDFFAYGDYLNDLWKYSP